MFTGQLIAGGLITQGLDKEKDMLVVAILRVLFGMILKMVTGKTQWQLMAHLHPYIVAMKGSTVSLVNHGRELSTKG